MQTTTEPTKRPPRVKLFATITTSGVAMHESVLTESEYNTPWVRARNEREALKIDDAAKPIQWRDVTENEALWPDEDDVWDQ